MATAVSPPSVSDEAPASRPNVPVSVWTAALSALVLMVFAAVGGWMRRWISDDGLIVLRTVRNLEAGHGPVFNAGERVEANTSTLWQYLIFLCAKITGAPLDSIAMWLALIFTVAAVGVAGLATAKVYRAPSLIFVPVGGLVYLALPPARDFATSGLEWGLSLLYLAVLWLLLVNWMLAGERRHRRSDSVTYWLAFWAGLSWLVRPELALYGGLVGILLLATAPTWRVAAGILAAALPLPAGYQIFRMGYYGLLTPHTAVAKSASDAQWARGWDYVLDLVQPHHLAVALALVAAMAGVLVWQASTLPTETPRNQRSRFRLRSRLGVVAVLGLAAVLHLLYVIRVGGDFMHGRMLLLPLFALLLPVFVMPVVNLGRRHLAASVAVSAGAVAVVAWAGTAATQVDVVDYDSFEADELGVVNEREFWTNATRRTTGDPPQRIEEFLPARVLGNWADSMGELEEDDAATMHMILVARDPDRYEWLVQDRQQWESDLRGLDPTVYHVNLGMTSMNAPLNVRIQDTVGLANPIGARQPRDPDGRVGHDKWLPWGWQLADTDADLNQIPSWFDREDAIMARAAMRSPEIAELLATSREPMSWSRFWANVAYSLGPGRSLEISDDPRDHLEPSQIAEIEDYVAATEEAVEEGRADELPPPPGTTGRQIAW